MAESIRSNYFGIFILAFVIMTVSVLTSFSYLPSLIIVLIQDTVLLAVLMIGKVEWFTALYVIFLATSFETNAFFADGGTAYYGFKNIHIAGFSNNLIVLIIGLVIYLAISQSMTIRFSKTGPEAPMGRMIVLNIIALVVGFSCILFGDNGASMNTTYLRIYVNEAYYGINTLLTMFFVYASFRTSKQITMNLFIDTVIAIILAECYVPYIGYYVGISGGYGGILVSTYAKLLVPLLLLFASYYPLKHKWFIYLSFFIGEVIPILYFKAGSGKEVLLLLLSLVFMVYFKVTKNQGKNNKKYIFVIFCLIEIAMLYILLPILIEMNIMFSAKAKQLYSLISFSTSGNYLTDMEGSPQVRIYELISVLKEYTSKPWSIPFGKGFGGSFQDYYGYFISLPSTLWHGKFSDFEFTNNYFYRMHELSRVPLTYGVFGIVTIASWVKTMLSNTSPMSLLGVIWAVMFINNSQTLACVLILGFVTAMYQGEVKYSFVGD